MGPRLGFLCMVGFCALLGVARCDQLSVGGGAARKLQLNFWNGFTGPDGRTMLGMIRKFNAENPDIQVSMQRMDWATYYNKLMVAAVDGRGPEMFVVHASTLPRMRRAHFLADMSGMFQAKGGLIPAADFDPYVLQQVQFGSELLGIPLDIHPQGLYVNRKLLASVGFERLPKTRTEFLQLARQLRVDEDRDGRPDRWGFAMTLWRNNFQTLIPQFGGRFLDSQGKADLNCPGNVRALEFLQQLGKDKLVPPPENGLGWVGYRQGKVAMVFDGVYMLGDLKRLNSLDWVGGPIPQIGDRPGTMADSHVLCARRGLGSIQRAAVQRFFQYLSDKSVAWADAGQVPARRSVRATPAFQAMPTQAAFATQIPSMVYPPRIPVLFEFTLEIDLAVEKVLRGRATPKAALDMANTNAQRFIERDRAEHRESSELGGPQ